MAVQSKEEKRNDKYEVEKIVNRRTRNNKVNCWVFFLNFPRFVNTIEIYTQIEYRIKWKGYPSKQNQWVKIEDCFCDEDVLAFERKSLQYIIGVGKNESVYSYGVKMTYNTSVIALSSEEVMEKWPDYLLQLLESRIQFIESNAVSFEITDIITENADGQPLWIIGRQFIWNLFLVQFRF